ncbi:MAG: hypothetical protein R3E76_03330 [Planctomycetota bacterium]
MLSTAGKSSQEVHRIVPRSTPVRDRQQASQSSRAEPYTRRQLLALVRVALSTILGAVQVLVYAGLTLVSSLPLLEGEEVNPLYPVTFATCGLVMICCWCCGAFGSGASKQQSLWRKLALLFLVAWFVAGSPFWLVALGNFEELFELPSGVVLALFTFPGVVMLSAAAPWIAPRRPE